MAPGKKVQMVAAPFIVPELIQCLYFPVNSPEGRPSSDAQNSFESQTIPATLLASCPGTDENALVTLNANEIPLHQGFILRSLILSIQGTAF